MLDGLSKFKTNNIILLNLTIIFGLLNGVLWCFFFIVEDSIEKILESVKLADGSSK